MKKISTVERTNIFFATGLVVCFLFASSVLASDSVNYVSNLLWNNDFKKGLKHWEYSGNTQPKIVNSDTIYGKNIYVSNSEERMNFTLYRTVKIPKSGKYRFKVLLDVQRENLTNQSIFGQLRVWQNGKVIGSSPAHVQGSYWYKQYDYLHKLELSEGSFVKLELKLWADKNVLVRIGRVDFGQIIEHSVGLYNSPNAISGLTQKGDGLYTVHLENSPYLYNVMHHPAKLEDKHFKKFASLNFQTVAFWLKWNNILNNPNDRFSGYNWTYLNKVIALAKKYNMRLELIWFGTYFSGTSLQSFNKWLPHKKDWLLKDASGNFVMHKVDNHFTFIPDYKNSELLAFEKKTIRDIMNHLKEHDATKRIISIQLNNELDPMWITGKQSQYTIANYINELGRAVKYSSYPIITRVNTGFGPTVNAAFRKQFIDFTGTDSYHRNVNYTDIATKALKESRFPHIAENGGYDNITSHMIAAFVNGAGYSSFNMTSGCHFTPAKPGIYGCTCRPWDKSYCHDHPEDWIELDKTRRVRNLNRGLNKLQSFIAGSTHGQRVGFNYKNGTQLPVLNPNEVRWLGPYKLNMRSYLNNGPVAMAVRRYNTIYFTSDKKTIFFLDRKPLKVESGQFNAQNQWKVFADKINDRPGQFGIWNGEYYFIIFAGEAVRVVY